MFFSKFFAAIGAASLLASASAGVIQKRSMTAPQVVANINVLTTMSQNLQSPANSINLLSPLLLLLGQGPLVIVITGFNNIILTANNDIQAMAGAEPFSVKSDEDAILAALTQFVRVHQELLSILIGKAGLLPKLPFVGAPVAAVLSTLEGVVDSIAYGLIGLCPDIGESLTGQQNSLDATLNIAINSFTFSL